uniref:Immunoglobulin domain-containing protein n=1 Tax=Chelonoidis abingdonii TaxID=106734 RepID=A0A8C0GED4_CHEAB
IHFLLIVWCALFLASDQEKTAMEGMSTTITCSYDRRKYMFNRKYWCHGGSRSSCDVLGDTENFVKSEYKGRVVLLDNRRGYFLVTMHQLVEEDSGMYWCGIERPYADMMTAVKLTVTEGKDSLNICRTERDQSEGDSSQGFSAPPWPSRHASVSSHADGSYAQDRDSDVPARIFQKNQAQDQGPPSVVILDTLDAPPGPRCTSSPISLCSIGASGAGGDYQPPPSYWYGGSAYSATKLPDSTGAGGRSRARVHTGPACPWPLLLLLL